MEKALDLILLSEVVPASSKATLTMATTPPHHAIVLQALAGTGKTHTVMEMVATLGEANVLLLSFTNAAVRVIKQRGARGRTFDSLFHETARKAGPWLPEDYEALRRLALTLGVSVAERYVIIDEAQDTPPEAADLLEVLRRNGTRIIIAGDPSQSIFQFLESRSLFPMPGDHTVIHMRHTRRCCEEVAMVVRDRFRLPMSTLEFFKGDRLETVVFQARCNRSLASLYTKILLTLRWTMTVCVADPDIFNSFVLENIMNAYKINKDDAERALETRRADTCDGSVRLFFSTVHGFKGSEADVAVLHEDVGLYREATNLQYVAVTRARFGVFDLGSLRWSGTEQARSFLRRVVHDGLYTEPPNLGNTAVVTRHPIGLMRMGLAGYAPALTKHSPTRSDVNAVLTSWSIRASFRGTIAPSTAIHGFKPTHDRRYKRIFDLGVLSAKQHADVCSLLSRMRMRALVGMYLVTQGHVRDVGHPWVVSAADAYCRIRRFKAGFRLTGLQQPLMYAREEIVKINTDAMESIAFHVDFRTKQMKGRADMVTRYAADSTVAVYQFGNNGLLQAYLNGSLLNGVSVAKTVCEETVVADTQPPDLAFGVDRRFYGDKDIWDDLIKN